VNAAVVVVDDQAAMGQERAHSLEAQVAQLLARPAHEAGPAPRRRWWHVGRY
jgi:hypothetical protein